MLLQLMKLILECREDWVQQELVAVGINLSCDEQNVKMMVKGPGLKLLMKRALQTQDSLLMKMIKNISQHRDEEIKKLFLVRIYVLITAVKCDCGFRILCHPSVK